VASDPVRVLVVDDTPAVRAVFGRLIAAEDDLVLAGAAGSAEEALRKLRRAAADVILLDLSIPEGAGAIPRLLDLDPDARILAVSAPSQGGDEPTLAALTMGAADTLARPRPGEFDAPYRAMMLHKIRLLGRMAKRARDRAAAPGEPALRPSGRRPDILAIGASTGGIHALGQLLAALPPRLSLPILVTQHLPGTFMEAFLRQLSAAAGQGAALARNGMAVLPGQILVAPGDAHLTVTVSGQGAAMVRLSQAPAASGCRPSVDPMFASCARLFGCHAMGVVLSGMGRDGAQGAAEIVEAGGTVLAQDAASSAVWGMPGAVAEAGLAAAILPPDQLALRIAAAAGAP
jgi:two-component system chemotaxis response regulator CheB